MSARQMIARTRVGKRSTAVIEREKSVYTGLWKGDKMRTQYSGQSAEPIPLIAEACDKTRNQSLALYANATRSTFASLCLQ